MLGWGEGRGLVAKYSNHVVAFVILSIWYATWPCSEKVGFLPTDPIPRVGVGVGGCWQNICYHVAAFPESLEVDMQHDHVLKKMKFDPLTTSPGSGCLGRMGVWGCPCCCISRLRWILTYWPHSQGRDGGKEGGRGYAGKLFAIMLLHSWLSVIWYESWPCCEPILRDRGWVKGLGTKYFSTMLLHFVYPFKLICSIAMF